LRIDIPDYIFDFVNEESFETVEEEIDELDLF